MSEHTPRHRIGAVARATGISPESLRVWERRYGGAPPSRTDAGGRLYSDADIDRLRLIKRLLDRGQSPSQIVPLGEAALRGMLSRLERQDEPSGPGLEALKARFLDHVNRLDMPAAHEVIARASLMLEPRVLTMELMIPALRELGNRWASGDISVCHEHAASAVIRSVLGLLLSSQPRHDGLPVVVVATPVGEHHEFGALMAALLAASASWRPVYLGANVPTEDLVTATVITGARALAISVVNPPARESIGALTELAETLPRTVSLVVGGPRARVVPALEHRAVIFDDLGALDAWLREGGRP